MIHKPLNAQNFPHLFFAGRSRITLQNSAKGSHVRLKISEKREKKDGKMVGTGRFFVFTSILNDGDTGWDFAGTFYSDTKGYSLGRTHTKGSQVDRILGFVQGALRNPQVLNEKRVNLFHEGRCCRCAMPLTHPDSIQLGVGPDCVKNMPENFILSLMPVI